MPNEDDYNGNGATEVGMGEEKVSQRFQECGSKDFWLGSGDMCVCAVVCVRS